ncbi:MAG: hypothetical protein HUK28_06740, partial [Methanobrevibacter sp.]|nr:hypothetical protein [Methanobrevibacter sp.]
MIAFVCLLSVSCISAADYNNDNDVVAVADAGTFTELNTVISSGGNISLTKDYIQTDSYGQITINKDTNINGNGHTIDAKEKSRIFNITNGVNVTLKNINFINGKAPLIGHEAEGGAIYTDSGSVTVINCTFNNNAAIESHQVGYGSGGAIYTYGGSVTVINCTFNNNTAVAGGAICSYDCSVTVSNSTFNNNTADDLGGAIFIGEGSVTVINCTFNNNTANYHGGAIRGEVEDSSIIVVDSKFKDCKATNGKDIGSIGCVTLMGNEYDGKHNYT